MHTNISKFLEIQHKSDVLVIDDTAIMLCILESNIRGLGLSVDTANNGIEGLEKFKSNSYRLVLIDYLMPVLDGAATVQLIREYEEYMKRPKTPVIGITANINKQVIEVCRNSGMNAVLPKPVKLEQLKGSICKYVEIEDAKDNCLF